MKRRILVTGLTLFQLYAYAQGNEPSLLEHFGFSPVQLGLGALIIFGLGMLLGRYLLNFDPRIKRMHILEKEMAICQLNVLKNQINPHFLFNSFNTLAGLIEDRPKIAVSFVENMSDFYRSMLQLGQKELIPLDEEIRLLKSFVYLQEQRFGGGFSFNIDLKNTENLYVVPLSLQMLVENALKHNIVSVHTPLIVRVHDNKKKYISVENNLQKKNQVEHSTQFGLESLSIRYKLLSALPLLIEETRAKFEVHIPVMEKSEIQRLLLEDNSPDEPSFEFTEVT